MSLKGVQGLSACHGSATLFILSAPCGRVVNPGWLWLDMTIPDLADQSVGLLVIKEGRHKVR